MPTDFCFDVAPFKELKSTEQAQVREHAQLISRRPNSVVLQADESPEFLWVIHSGHVQLDEDGALHILGSGGCLPWRALLTGSNRASAKALDDVLLWQLPKTMVLNLLGNNTAFSTQVFAELAHHLADDTGAAHHREMTSLMLMRVKDAFLQKPFYVDGQLDVVSVCRVLSERKATNVLVRDTQDGVPRVGMFTTTDLRDAVLNSIAPNLLPVRDVGRFDLIAIHPDAELFDALLIMLRHRVHRVLVRDGDTIVGVLGQLDLMSFISNHSHIITRQVEQAANLDELRLGALQVDGAITMLQRAGMRIEIISRLVTELNDQIFARLWHLLAPIELVRNSCLLVMGSEGRGEQILKTDQDNALLLRDGYQHRDIRTITQQFSQALLSFGYPPCPGNIMVTNPLWCQSLASFRVTLGHWLFDAKPEGKMNLAIFMDARAVAGDAELLTNAREHALKLVHGSSIFLGQMAAAVDLFGEPAIGWWNRLTTLHLREPETLDLKKIGTFPLVHGLRVLALQHRLDAVGTVERLKALVGESELTPAQGADLTWALHVLMDLKLRNNLRQTTLSQPVTNLVELATLSTMDREKLHNALNIVRQFKQHLRLRYRLES